MPQLTNQKHEVFCRKIIEAAKSGKSQGWAYRAAGYDCEDGAAEAAACRLLKTVKVQDRIAELNAPAIRKTRVSVESLLNELDTTIGFARADGQHSTVVQALTLSAKLVGLLRERVEIGGPGAFDQCTSTEEVIDKLLAELETEDALATCDTMRALIEARAATAAIPIEQATKIKRVDEASSELIKALR